MEGTSDQMFFEQIRTRIGASNNTVIYTPDSIELSSAEGGNRGRAFLLAKTIADAKLLDRIVCFLDADFDPVLGNLPPPGVIFTDERDMIGYVLDLQGIALLLQLLGAGKTSTFQFLSDLYAVVREWSFIRALSQREKLNLKVNATINKRISKYIVENGNNKSSDRRKIVESVLQNTFKDRSKTEEILLAVKEFENCEEWCDTCFCHGHDAAQYISYATKKSAQEIERLLLAVLIAQSDRISSRENISKVVEFLQEEA